jgi:hypothetical protein
MRDGKRVGPAAALEDARERVRSSLVTLPERLRSLEPAEPRYPVEVSPGLIEARERIESELTSNG